MPTNLYGPKDNYHPRNSHVAALLKKFIEAKELNISKVKCWGNGTPEENLCMLMISQVQLFFS